MKHRRKRKQGERGIAPYILAGIIIAMLTLLLVLYAADNAGGNGAKKRSPGQGVPAPRLDSATAPEQATEKEAVPEPQEGTPEVHTGQGQTPIDQENAGVPAEDFYQVMDSGKWAYIIERSIQLQARQDLINRIDALLASRGSPLAGLGHAFVSAQERTGVSARLMIGLTAAESTFGTNGYLCTQNHNCFGMKGPQPQIGIPAQGGWCWWPDYGASIQGAADFIVHYWGQAQTAYNLRGYCEGNPPEWIQTVEGTRQSI